MCFSRFTKLRLLLLFLFFLHEPLTYNCVRINLSTSLHWVLDVAFKEDDCRVRKGYADENFAIARHLAVNKLKNEKSFKRGMKAKRKKAGWDDNYLIKVLFA